MCFREYGQFGKRFNSGKLKKMGFSLGYTSRGTNIKSGLAVSFSRGKERKEIIDNDKLLQFAKNKFDHEKLKQYINKTQILILEESKN